MSVITSSNFAKALWPGVNAWYGAAYKDYPVEFEKLFDKSTSRKQFEEDVGTTGLGLAVVKGEGAPITFDNMRQAYTTRYVHTEYALGFIITQIMVEDDVYDVIGQKRAKALARSMRQTKEIIGANVYNRAFNTSYVGGDGVTLLNSAHPNFTGGTWSNLLATAADLSEAALEQAVIDIAGFRDDRGLQISVKPKTLVLPKDLMFEARRILGSDLRVGTTNNDLNALKDMGMFGNVVVNHYLTDTDAWFIRTDVDDGMKYFERRADSFDMDADFDTSNAKYKAQSRYSFGWTDPRALYGTPGA